MSERFTNADGTLAEDPDADDGVLDGIVLENARSVGSASLLGIGLPARLRQQHTAGRYFLARCGAQTPTERAENWQIYFRRPLFVCGLQSQLSDLAEAEHHPSFDRWHLLLPPGDDPGYRWLRGLGPGETVNLMGPLGNGFSLAQECRNLLILTEPARLPALLPIVEQMLDRNGRVTVIIRDNDGGNPTPLLALLPLAVEVRLAASTEQWRRHVDDAVPWADQICATLPPSQYRTLAEIIVGRRFRLEQGFAQMLVHADLVCGVGACLACVVPTANGSVTRACVHGPVLDLTRLSE